MKNNEYKKQLFVDISELVTRDAKTGIQRVVRSILMQLLMSPPSGFDVRPVYFTGDDDELIYANTFTKSFYPDVPLPKKDDAIKMKSGDVFLALDLTAHLIHRMVPVLLEMKRLNVKINYIVYDLIPLLNDWHTVEMKEAFKEWIRYLTLHADKIICISDAVANDVKEWVANNPADRETSLQISHFHLGADIESSLPTTGLPDNSQALLTSVSNMPTVLMVGTIEPRKGHAQALDSFELLWRKQVDVNLVIVGKYGWIADDFVEKIQQHPELGRRLFWLDDISDEFLELIYQKSDVLLAASEAEGFGLPLIEAAQHHLPIIARDIPVFKEVAGDFAYYFSGLDAESLANALLEWMELNNSHKAPQSIEMPWMTWEQSTKQLLSKLIQRG